MVLTTLMLTTTFVLGQVPEPSAKEVKTVLDYYYAGERPILAEAFLCKTVERKDKATRHDCIERFGDDAKKGELAYVYMVAMVPRGKEAPLMVQASHNGVVRSTKDVTLKGTWFRSRAWRAFSLGKPGKWEFKVLSGDGKVLKAMSIDIAES